MTASTALAGTVRWVVVPYTPRPPFRLYAGEGHPPIVVATPGRIIVAAKVGGDPDFTYLVPAKARPVLLLNEPPAEQHREVLGLRLLRLSKLPPERRKAIRDQEEELLFHLSPDRFELPEESAVMIGAIARLHVDAVADDPPAGKLEPGELAVISDRLIRFCRLDTRLLVERRLHELAARRRDTT